MATHSVFLLGKFHGQRSLVGSSPWGSQSQTGLGTHACTHMKSRLPGQCRAGNPVSGAERQHRQESWRLTCANSSAHRRQDRSLKSS